MLSSTSGCAALNDFLDKLALNTGEHTGKGVGATIAKIVPPAPAIVVVEPKGGRFCEQMLKLGWPLVLTPEAAATLRQLPRETKIPIIGAQRHGLAECDWPMPVSGEPT